MFPPTTYDVKVMVACVASVRLTETCAYGPGNPEMAALPRPRSNESTAPAFEVNPARAITEIAISANSFFTILPPPGEVVRVERVEQMQALGQMVVISINCYC